MISFRKSATEEIPFVELHTYRLVAFGPPEWRNVEQMTRANIGRLRRAVSETVTLGTGAPDNLEKGYETQVWLAVSKDTDACVSGHYFHHKKQARFLPIAKDIDVQEKLLAGCAAITGVQMVKRKLG